MAVTAEAPAPETNIESAFAKVSSQSASLITDQLPSGRQRTQRAIAVAAHARARYCVTPSPQPNISTPPKLPNSTVVITIDTAKSAMSVLHALRISERSRRNTSVCPLRTKAMAVDVRDEHSTYSIRVDATNRRSVTAPCNRLSMRIGRYGNNSASIRSGGSTDSNPSTNRPDDLSPSILTTLYVLVDSGSNNTAPQHDRCGAVLSCGCLADMAQAPRSPGIKSPSAR